MKYLHRPELRAWSSFDEGRDLDFNSVALIREGGNVLVDPLPMCDHDLQQLGELGGAASIVVTNSDHVRAAAALAELFGARLLGPRGERATFSLRCDDWLGEGDCVVPELRVLELEGSKTDGELSLLFDGHTLITSDLVRAQRPGCLNLLPDEKLKDKGAALRSVARLAELPGLQAVLVGDGWHLFADCAQALARLG